MKNYVAAAVSLPIALSLLAGCAPSPSPFSRDSERELRRAVLESTQRELEDAQRYPKPIVTHRDEIGSDLSIKPEALAELITMAGAKSYDGVTVDLGKDLTGRPARSVPVSLERLIHSAVEHNVAIEFARLSPAISEAQVQSAEAAFDWTLFSNANYSNQDSPRPGTAFGSSSSFTPNFDRFDSITNSTGLKRVMVGGGRLTIQEDLSYNHNTTPGQNTSPNPAEIASFTAQWDQPLLKGAGSEVTQAEIRINRNAERTSVQTFRRDLMRVVSDIEKQYWELVQAYGNLLILERLQERGEKTRDQLKTRAKLDANQAQIADAISRVERRKVDVLRAQQTVRELSDKLKQLANDPSMPVGSELVLIPSDRPFDAPIQFSLLESMRQAIQNRPEVQQSIIAIDDASIRQMVARNQRLPDLNMRLQAKWASMDNNLWQSTNSQFNGEFIDYLVGGSFEMPIGNRKAEAEYRRRRLERMQTVLAYKNSVQTAITETKLALNKTIVSFKQISQAADSRIAASEVLRVLYIEKKLDQATSVERLDLELNRQESLAAAEQTEIESLVQYNSNLTDLFLAMGTLLERNKIDVIVPTASDVQWDNAGR